MVAERLRAALGSVADESLRTATLVGLASVPVTVAVSLDVHLERVSFEAPFQYVPLDIPLESASLATAPDHISLWPLLVAGIVVGFVYSRRETGVGRAGKRTGLVGSLPVLWQAADMFRFAWSGSIGYPLLGTGFAFMITALGVAFAVVVAMLGAKIGAWFAGTADWSRPRDADA